MFPVHSTNPHMSPLIESDNIEEKAQHLIEYYYGDIEYATPEHFEIILKGKPDIFSQEEYGRTILMKTARVGNHVLLKHILETSDVNNIDKADDNGLTALAHAILATFEKGHACAKVLLKAGANPNAYKKIWCYGMMTSGTPLYLATYMNKLHNMELLLNYFAIYESQSDPGPEPEFVKELGRKVIKEKWNKCRLILLGYKDPQSPLSNIPYELIQKIIEERMSL